MLNKPPALSANINIKGIFRNGIRVPRAVCLKSNTCLICIKPMSVEPVVYVACTELTTRLIELSGDRKMHWLYLSTMKIDARQMDSNVVSMVGS